MQSPAKSGQKQEYGTSHLCILGGGGEVRRSRDERNHANLLTAPSAPEHTDNGVRQEVRKIKRNLMEEYRVDLKVHLGNRTRSDIGNCWPDGYPKRTTSPG